MNGAGEKYKQNDQNNVKQCGGCAQEEEEEGDGTGAKRERER